MCLSSQVKKSGQCQLGDKKKKQYFSIVSLPTDSVIVDHAVVVSILNFQIGDSYNQSWQYNYFINKIRKH
jgi:hypothetical protein